VLLHPPPGRQRRAPLSAGLPGRQAGGAGDGEPAPPRPELLRFGAHLALTLVALELIPAPHDARAAPDQAPLQARARARSRGARAAGATPRVWAKGSLEARQRTKAARCAWPRRAQSA